MGAALPKRRWLEQREEQCCFSPCRSWLQLQPPLDTGMLLWPDALHEGLRPQRALT